MPKRYRDIAGDGGSNIVAQVERQQARLRERLSRVRAIVAIVSGKGGVGKSSVTANLAACFALNGRQVGVLDADLNGPTMAKMLGVRGGKLVVRAGGVEPPRNALGVKVMSMDLLLPSDSAPLTWDAPTQDEAHTWRGTMEANALREFLADTDFIGAVVFEPAHPATGHFWGRAIGWPVVYDQDGDVAIRAPDGRGPFITFGPPGVAKSGKNRLHLDLAPHANDDQATEVDRLIALGASRIDIGQGDVPWVVLADPDGNEFCVLSPQ